MKYRGRPASIAVLGGVLLALTLLPYADGNVFPDLNPQITKGALSQFSALANRTLIMALHEAKPFVFFDCSWEDAVADWNAMNPTNSRDRVPLPKSPVQPPKTCKRENECPDAPDSEPFCGITVGIARDICNILNCTIQFYIASENPHLWENEEEALRAIGAGSDIGERHWADVAGGAIILTSDRAAMSHFTTPYFQTGFQMVTRRPVKAIDWFSFIAPFDLSLWIFLFGEMLVAAVILWIIESPENTMAADGESDLVEGKVASLFDAFYWTFTTFTCYVDKCPKTPGGKVVMMAQGFYMVVILASYTANLASSLVSSAIEPPFSGWELGDSPVVPDNIGSVNIAIPGGGAEEEYLTIQSAKWQKSFDNMHTFDEIELALDSVLCGNDDLMFHDESMILYYLNTAMVDFGNGVYTSDICNVSQLTNADSSSAFPAAVQNPRCALMPSGSVFNQHSYAFAFGNDDTSFIPWTQAITMLQESGGIAKYFSSGQGYDYKIGSAGIQQFELECGGGDSGGVDGFVMEEFYGLTLICGIFMLVGLMQCEAMTITMMQDLVGRVLKRRNTLSTTVKTSGDALGDCHGEGLDPAVLAAINAALTMAAVGGPRGLENARNSFEEAWTRSLEGVVGGVKPDMNATPPVLPPRPSLQVSASW